MDTKRIPGTRWAVCAHRGGSEGAAPGTLAAFKHAANARFDYVEFDVRRLADGALVAFHDAAVGGHALRGLALDGLRREAGYEVPSVPDVMEALRGLTTAHIDLKEPGYEAEIVALANSLLGPGAYVVTSLEDETIATIKRAFPAIRVGLTLGRDLAGTNILARVRVRSSELFPRRRLQACGADFVSVHYRLAVLHVLRTARRMGLPAFVWTVNDEKRLRRLARYPAVECVVTDLPGKVSGLRDRRSAAGPRSA